MAATDSAEVSLPQRFFSYFQHEVTALQEQMDRLADTALIAGERSDATDHCLAGIARLSSEVKDASSYLPSYDQRTYAEAIKALQEKLQDAKDAFAPKPRFFFKSARKSPSAISLSDAAEMAAQKHRGLPGYLSPNASSPNSSHSVTPNYLKTPPNERSAADNRPVPPAPPPTAVNSTKMSSTSASTPPSSDLEQTPERPSLSTSATSMSITNQSRAHIILPASSLHSQTPCTLQKLTSCCLDLSSPTTASAPFASLTINTVSSSLLLCGVVAGPAHITGVKSSVLVISCRQFRMHECQDVEVYLHCTSRPIIENCSGVRFAELPKTYADFLQTSLSNNNKSKLQTQESNLWDQVDDFKWLKSDPSPNWSLIPAEYKIQEDTWREIVPGGPGWSLEDILKAVKVSK